MRDQGFRGLSQATRRGHVFLLVSTCVIGAVVVGMTVTAAILLLTNASGPWFPVHQEFVKVGFQAVAIGALGGLAKLTIDASRDREAKQNELRERRHQYIAAVVAASHQVDNARVVLRANRSVSTWTTIVTSNLIPARTRLREITHDMRNWTEAGLPVFDTSGGVIVRDLESMSRYLYALVEEYAEDKLSLGEEQRSAERAEGQARTELLTKIWGKIKDLELFKDFIEDGETYGQYRKEYLTVLSAMRSSLLSNSAEEVGGKDTEAAGTATGDKGLGSEAQPGQARGDFKQVGEKVEDGFPKD